MAPNRLISTAKSSDASLHAALHPLVLLTISDYITRHTLRQLQQPIIGVLLGQQNGREITIELAYDVRLVEQGSAQWQLHEAFFKDRLQQYKDVHKEPPLELVGWWTLTPASGPSMEVMNIHQYIMENYNESALLLAFHPEAVKHTAVSNGSAPGVKLPLTIYETVYESNKAEGDTNAMDVEGEEGTGGETLQLRLREMPYEIATGEAEMIGVDFVARGGGNATAIDDTFAAAHATKQEASSKQKEAADGQASGKRIPDSQKTYLNSEEEELLAFLTTRANAIKMLQSRISLLKERLASLPPSYLTVSGASAQGADPEPSEAMPHQLLRAILALTAKLSLVAAYDPSQLATEATAARSDGALVDLLATLGTSTRRARELGGRFAARETDRRLRGGGGGARGGAFFAGDEAPLDQDILVGWKHGGSSFGPPHGNDLQMEM